MLVGDGSANLCVDTGAGHIVQLRACESGATTSQHLSYRVEFAQVGPPAGKTGRCFGPESTFRQQTEAQVTLNDCSTEKLVSDAATFNMYVFH